MPYRPMPLSVAEEAPRPVQKRRGWRRCCNGHRLTKRTIYIDTKGCTTCKICRSASALRNYYRKKQAIQP